MGYVVVAVVSLAIGVIFGRNISHEVDTAKDEIKKELPKL